MARKSDSAREGSRWINQRPSGDEVASWFVQNAPMHEGMEPERYVTGVTLIPAKEKPKILSPERRDRRRAEQLVWTPYVKVETRVAYFWDLMAAPPGVGRRHRAGPRRAARGERATNTICPPGFFRMPIQKADGKTRRCTSASRSA
jgi:hypothetical protein